jgi:hypothetical protein
MIAAGAERLLEAALVSESGPGGVAPRMILVAPPPISKLTEYAEMFEGGADRALSLPPLYRGGRLAPRRGLRRRGRDHFMLAARRHTLRARLARDPRRSDGGSGSDDARVEGRQAPRPLPGA